MHSHLDGYKNLHVGWPPPYEDSILKLNRTGATGYIGGDFLAETLTSQPDWNISCLVRNAEKATELTAKYPQLRIVEGDLDLVGIIEEEVSQANVVLHFANSDHAQSAHAIA